MSDLRIFSYLPNPRLYKATIAARLTGVDVEIRGAAPNALGDWLWDFDARPLDDADRANTAYAHTARAGFAGTLFKTDAFLRANPFGTVPVAFSPDGATGIFESNSLLRAVARLARSGPALYGSDAYSASRIDGFLDASLNFAHTTQRYLFGLMGAGLTQALDADMQGALAVFLGGIDGALGDAQAFIVGDTITLADIAFCAELALFAISRTERARTERAGFRVLFDDTLAARYPRAWRHFQFLIEHPAFAPDLRPYYEDMTLEKFWRGGA